MAAMSRKLMVLWCDGTTESLRVNAPVLVMILANAKKHYRIEVRTLGHSLHLAALQIRRNTSVPLVPPNPNEFVRAASMFMSRAMCGT